MAKTFFMALAVCLAHTALPGQTFTTSARGMAAFRRGWDQKTFLRMLAAAPPASLVLFDAEEKDQGQDFGHAMPEDAEDGEDTGGVESVESAEGAESVDRPREGSVWEQYFERVRREDPFALLNLNFMHLAIGDGVGEELRAREGWPGQKPRWAIFDAAGKLIADGGALPTAARLAEVCAGAGIVGEIETHRRFLREHPSHEEARQAMLREMLGVAEIRTRHFLQVPEYRATGLQLSTEIDGVDTGLQDAGAPTARQIETLPDLTADADERIWGEYCVWFSRHLEGTLWQAGGDPPKAGIMRNDTRPTASPWARFSPLAKAAYSKAAPKVEAALARQPTSAALWGLWLTLHKTGAGKSMKDLLATLKPGPNVAPADWPPTSIRAPYLKLCREAGDWKAILDLVGPTWAVMGANAADMRQHWPDLRESFGKSMPGFTLVDLAGFSQGFWLSNGEAYLEALLRQQRLSEAEDMIKTWASNHGWPGAFPAAAAIAERLGHEGVAKAWRELGQTR
jgi:hypothetical protein